jgi:hypothetical protein
MAPNACPSGRSAVGNTFRGLHTIATELEGANV